MNHQKHHPEEIIIFTRYPRPGNVKTRLIPELGPEGAAAVHRALTEQVVRTARQLVRENNIRLSVYHAGGSQRQMEDWLGRGLCYQEQEGGDLGERMLGAFRDAWQRGARHALLIGSDCPAIDTGLLCEALAAVAERELVLGPAADGGYYLIGAAADLPENTLKYLFTGIAWGSSAVLQETLERARRTDIRVSILKELHDIDQPSDLTYFRHHSDPQ